MNHAKHVEDMAQALLAARRERRQQPLPATAPTETEAYAVQERVAELMGFGPRAGALHWKAGPVVEGAPQIFSPLPPAGVLASPALCEASEHHHLAIEAEVAFRFGAAATPVAMCAAIELVDTRWQGGLQAGPRAKLADFMVHGALVLGAWQPMREDIDWAAQACRVRIGAQVHEFRGSHVNVDPLAVLPGWMRHVHDVREGMVVTTGTWCGLLWATPDDEVTVTFDGIGEAVLRFG